MPGMLHIHATGKMPKMQLKNSQPTPGKILAKRPLREIQTPAQKTNKKTRWIT